MKIYKITEASEYLGVSINRLKTLANTILEKVEIDEEKLEQLLKNDFDINGMACDWVVEWGHANIANAISQADGLVKVK